MIPADRLAMVLAEVHDELTEIAETLAAVNESADHADDWLHERLHDAYEAILTAAAHLDPPDP